MSETAPKLFISYSWTTPELEQWVLTLGTELQESGVDVTLDKWDLREGQDSFAFMEKMVTDPAITKVALICDQAYAEKADGRSGGVGTETQIITPEVYAKQDQTKFVAVLAESDDNGSPYLPTYYKSRIYIDLSTDDRYASNFEQLLRWIYDKPLHVKPPVGKTPAFLTDSDNVVSLGTAAVARRAIEAIRSSREHAEGALSEYFTTFATNLENIRLSDSEEEFDELVVQSIDGCLSVRNKLVEVMFAFAQYSDSESSRRLVHRFLEQLFPYLDRPEGVTSWTRWDFDNFRFVVHEVFLYIIAILLRHERFETVGVLLRGPYFLGTDKSANSDGLVPFSYLLQPLDSLAHRNDRLKLNRASLQADFIEKRSHHSGLHFRELMQADFLLFMRASLDSLRFDSWQGWCPVTLVYTSRLSTPFEVFARAQSTIYFNLLRKAFDVETKDDFAPLFKAFADRRIRIPDWDLHSFSPTVLSAYERMASRP